MSTFRLLGAVAVAAVAALPLFVARAETTTHDVGTLTARCRMLITEFDQRAKSAPSSVDARMWRLRAQGADECFGPDSELYTMRLGVADLARALRAIGVDVPRTAPN